MFGLAQLYQLRGRVGRSKMRAYALFTMPANRKLTEQAERRLKVLQSLDTLGAGFQLASHDLDIRGAGNLLGDEQSGHIKEVGYELYQQMLEEAVAALKAGVEFESRRRNGRRRSDRRAGDDPRALRHRSARCGSTLYRASSTLDDDGDIQSFGAELVDRFGPLPEEVAAAARDRRDQGAVPRANVEKVEAGPKGIIVAFRDNEFANPEGLVALCREAGHVGEGAPRHARRLHRRFRDGRAAPQGHAPPADRSGPDRGAQEGRLTARALESLLCFYGNAPSFRGAAQPRAWDVLVVKGSVDFLVWSPGCDEGVCGDEKLSGDGDQRDLGGFSGQAQGVVVGFSRRVVADGDQGGHVERGSDAGPAAGDGGAGRALPDWLTCGAKPARLAIAARSVWPSSGRSVASKLAIRGPMPGIEVRMASVVASSGSAVRRLGELGLDLGAGGRVLGDRRAVAGDSSASLACLRRVFSIAIISTSWRRRIEIALRRVWSSEGSGRKASLMTTAKRAIRPASSLSVLARRPSASRNALIRRGLTRPTSKPAGKSPDQAQGVRADRLQNERGEHHRRHVDAHEVGETGCMGIAGMQAEEGEGCQREQQPSDAGQAGKRS